MFKARVSPENITVEDCLQLKLNTVNRLKLLYPVESRSNALSSDSSLLDLLTVPVEKKLKFKPFSDRIIQPFYKYSSKGEKYEAPSPPKKPSIEPQTATKFFQKQSEWLMKKQNPIEEQQLSQQQSQSQIEGQEQLVPIVSKVNSKNSWKKAQRTHQKYLQQGIKQQTEREKLQKQVEIVKYSKLEVKLKELMRYDTSLLETLQKIQKKLYLLQHGDEDDGDNGDDIEEEEDDLVDLNDLHDVEEKLCLTKEQEKDENEEEQEEPMIEKLEQPLQQQQQQQQQQREEPNPPISEKIIQTTHSQTTIKTRATLIPKKVEPPPPQPLKVHQPTLCLDSDEIHLPELDMDGRVLFPVNDLDSEWDKLSEMESENRDEPTRTTTPPTRPLQPFVDVHLFLQTMEERSLSNLGAGDDIDSDHSSFDSHDSDHNHQNHDDDDDHYDDDSISVY